MVLVQITIINNYPNSLLTIKTISEIKFEHNFENVNLGNLIEISSKINSINVSETLFRKIFQETFSNIYSKIISEIFFIISIPENSFEIISNYISEIIFETSPNLFYDLISEIISETSSDIMFPNLSLA